MSVPTDRPSNEAAIAIHHAQAGLFRSRYDELERDPYSSAFAYGRRQIDLILDGYLPSDGQGRRLLDAGCGTGQALRTYAARGFDCVGLDAADAMVEAARAANAGLQIHSGDVERLPFADASFDVVLSIEVIRYLRDASIALREFHRVLKPGGLALVTAMPPLTLTGYALVNQLTSRVQIGRYSRVRQYFHTAGQLRRLAWEASFPWAEVKAAFWGPFRTVEPLLGKLAPATLRAWEPIDRLLPPLTLLHNFSNHLLLAARKSVAYQAG